MCTHVVSYDQEWQDEESDDWHEDTYEWKEKKWEEKRRRTPFDPKFVHRGFVAGISPLFCVASLFFRDAFQQNGGVHQGRHRKLLLCLACPSASLIFSCISGCDQGGMELAFVALRPDLNLDIRDTADIAQKYRRLLKTDGVIAKFEPVHANSIIVTNEEGDMFQIQAFLMKQEEVLKFRCVGPPRTCFHAVHGAVAWHVVDAGVLCFACGRWKDQDYFPQGTTPTPSIDAKKPKFNPMSEEKKAELAKKQKEKRERKKKKAKKKKNKSKGKTADDKSEPESASTSDHSEL